MDDFYEKLPEEKKIPDDPLYVIIGGVLLSIALIAIAVCVYLKVIQIAPT